MLLALGCSLRKSAANHTAGLYINKELNRYDKSSPKDLKQRGRSGVLFTFPDMKQGASKTSPVLKDPKTASNVRTVFLPGTVLATFRERKAAQEVDCVGNSNIPSSSKKHNPWNHCGSRDCVDLLSRFEPPTSSLPTSPAKFLTYFSVIYSRFCSFLFIFRHSLKTAFPCIPLLSVAGYVVRNPCSTWSSRPEAILFQAEKVVQFESAYLKSAVSSEEVSSDVLQGRPVNWAAFLHSILFRIYNYLIEYHHKLCYTNLKSDEYRIYFGSY